MNSRNNDPERIVPRENIDFGLDASIPRYWYDNDPYKTRVMDGMQLYFPDGERYFITSVRPYRERITDPVLARHVKDFIRQEGQHGIAHTRFNQLLALGPQMVEWEFIGNSGWRVPCELNVTALEHAGQPAWLISVRDITERRNSESKIRRLSAYDNLTGLLNRNQMQALLQTALERREEDTPHFALLHIDIAHFKNINDTFGHGTGDALLR